MAETIPTPRPAPPKVIEKASAPDYAPFKQDPECEAKLKKAGIAYSKEGAVTGKKGCGFDESFSVHSIANDITIQPKTQLRCETILALNQWVQKSVLPATEKLGASVKLKSLRHGSTYVCRRRNNLATGKLSEHAKGAAIDIIAFEFEGHAPILVMPRDQKPAKETKFQNAVRKGACGPFTTVLGPGSDAYHDDHFHFDIAQRKGRYLYCK